MPLRERNARGASPEPVPRAVGQQAYGCQPISAAEHFIPPEILSPCLSAEARTGTPSALLASASRPRPGRGRGPQDLGRTAGRALELGKALLSRHSSAIENPQPSIRRKHHAWS
jgi:hypothetical protein